LLQKGPLNCHRRCCHALLNDALSLALPAPGAPGPPVCALGLQPAQSSPPPKITLTSCMAAGLARMCIGLARRTFAAAADQAQRLGRPIDVPGGPRPAGAGRRANPSASQNRYQHWVQPVPIGIPWGECLRRGGRSQCDRQFHQSAAKLFPGPFPVKALRPNMLSLARALCASRVRCRPCVCLGSTIDTCIHRQ
jgi:hypothetical protein